MPYWAPVPRRWAGRLRVRVAAELEGGRNSPDAELRDLLGADALCAVPRDHLTDLVPNPAHPVAGRPVARD